MTIEVLLNRNSNTIVHEDAFELHTDYGVFQVVGHKGHVIAMYPVAAVSSITFVR